MVKIDIITLFPGMFEGPFATSMLKKAQDKKLVEINFIDLRKFGIGPHKQVDDTPYGGGDGMVLRADVVIPAIEAAKRSTKRKRNPKSVIRSAKVILLTPQGRTLEQPLVRTLSKQEHLILVCGHYEGFDERIRKFVDMQISIGDYVLTGGEIPAMVIVDSVVRLLPGVLGGASSAAEESFSQGSTLEYPQYTRPAEFAGKKIPKVLLSGNHAEIKKWRQAQSLKRTKHK